MFRGKKTQKNENLGFDRPFSEFEVPNNIASMVRGSKIPAAVHWIIIWLSSFFKPPDIALYTGVSERSVERILNFFKVHGTIDHKEEERKRRRQYLRDQDVEVCEVYYLLKFTTLCCTVSLRHDQQAARLIS